jgi:hypothetical protein
MVYEFGKPPDRFFIFYKKRYPTQMVLSSLYKTHTRPSRLSSTSKLLIIFNNLRLDLCCQRFIIATGFGIKVFVNALEM